MAQRIPSTVQPVRSWGRLTAHQHQVTEPAFAVQAQAVLTEGEGLTLPFGAGRSYGDVCLNAGGVLLRTTWLDRLIAADWSTGVIRVEAGLTIDGLLRIAVPRGWMMPVTPGTKFCTLGGLVANDVHGKNHEVAGAIGCHVRRLGLLRSDLGFVEVAPDQRPDLFKATVGGLGLTGVIVWVELVLKRIASSELEVETIPMSDLDAFFRLAQDSRDWEYTVAWVDCLASGAAVGRGLFMRARHQDSGPLTVHRPPRLSVPIDAPGWLLSGPTVRAFNTIYRAWNGSPGVRNMSYDQFYYPLDSVGGWNRLYGPRGFFQHQSVVPTAAAPEALRKLLDATAAAGEGSFLLVLKMFGDIRSPGLLSFPRPGATLALDFANRGDGTKRLLRTMADIVMAAGGRLYPAKDATMTAEAFQTGYPEWRAVEALRDPKIMSDFWRRVTQ